MKKQMSLSLMSLILAFAAGSAYADDGMSHMDMMNNQFHMHMQNAENAAMKMSNEKSDQKKLQYMRDHMDNMVNMMDMMNRMMVSDENRRYMHMGDCPGAQAMGAVSDSGGESARLEDWKNRSEFMEKRMSMMQEMMEQMLRHMEQLENK